MKRILKILTSRAVLTALSILVQFLIIFAFVRYFSEAFVYYYSATFIISIIFCVVVVNKNTNSAYKIAWILLLMCLPLFGVAIFLILDGISLVKFKKKRMLKITDNIKEHLSKDEELTIENDLAKGQSRYINDYAYSPPIKNTRSKYFSGGEEFFKELLCELKKAEKSIYMEYFIIKQGYMWDEIKTVLLERAQNGVDVRIIYDDMGSIDQLKWREMKKLKKAGIRIKSFNPFVPVISTILNNRDHRKICTIDTKVAFCGGVNIADEYINLKEKFGHFKDSAIALYGEGAYSFEVFFLTLWEYITGEKTKLQKPQYEQLDEGVYQPYTDSPIDTEPVGENIYINIISNAKKYVYISTPYFVVDEEMLRAITNSAKSGVEIKLIVPHIPDKKAVNQVTKSYYSRLISAGVKVYEYKLGFNHSKLVISDDKIATVGSVNFDYRSFYLSFECGVWMYNTNTIKDILFDYNTMLTNSLPITSENCKASIFTRLFRAILSAFSPLF
ncbi:MAG: cardiolipin synthase [Clostridia bacterium]|nr:cardiolipin synthase [Clostridia bacterium]